MKYRIRVFTSLFIFILAFSYFVYAEDLTLEKALKLGLENSNTIQKAEDEVQDLEKQLQRIKAGEDWQLDLGADYSYGNSSTDNFSISGGDSSAGLSVSATKTYHSGLQLTTKTSITDDELTPDFSINMNKSLYPGIPTEQEQSFFRINKSLMKAETKLDVQKADSIISWLEGYLKLQRMIEKQKLYQEDMEKAEQNLKEVMKRIEIGDAGDNQLISAKLSLEDAKYRIKDAQNQIEEARYSLLNSMGLLSSNNADDEKIRIKFEQDYLEQLKLKTIHLMDTYLGVEKGESEIDYENIREKSVQNLMPMVEDNSTDLQSLLLDKEVLERELEWLKKEDQTRINLDSSYNSVREEFTIGLKLSYNLYDGGLSEMSLTDKEKAIEDNKIEYKDKYNSLEHQLGQLIDELELGQMSYHKELLNGEKTEYELNAAEQQLDAGLIDYEEYQNYWISSAESKINLESLNDQLFIDRLKFVKFISRDDFSSIMGGVFRL